MRCSTPGCKNQGRFFFNVWYVCSDCYDSLIKRKIEQSKPTREVIQNEML